MCPEQVVSFNEYDDYIELELTKQTVSTSLLIAADGANSHIRKLASIGTTGWDYQQSAMLINVATEAEQQDITWQQFFPTGPLAMLPLSGRYASLAWYHQRDEIKRLASLTNEQLTEEVNTKFPKRLGKIEVIDKASFPLTRRHANQYVKGRVVLLGDAAHTINPLAGQGVNIGFKDVKALQNVIANALGEGNVWHSAVVLAAYEKARRADNFMMMSSMDLLYKTFSNTSPLLKAVRNIGLFTAQRSKILKNKALVYACGLS